MSPRVFVGVLPRAVLEALLAQPTTPRNGVPILVQVFDVGGCELAFRHDGRWGVPVVLAEQTEETS